MAREKNDGKGRIGGRAKGTPNKVTTDIKGFFSKVLTKNQKQLEKDFLEMEATDRWRIAEKIAQYVIPKQKAVENTINYDQLPEEQINSIIKDITKNLEDE